MIIELGKISSDGSAYREELSGDVLELEGDTFVRADGPVVCDFFVSLVPHEAIVKGSIEAQVSLLCSRCAGFFSTTIAVLDFLHVYPITEGTEKIDLGPDIREDVLLALPGYPRCGWEGEGICPHSGVNLEALKQEEPPPADSPWRVLDDLGQR